MAQNSNLKSVGFEHGLDACVLLNVGTDAVSDKTMANTVEAILGAVELDGGSEALMQVATRLSLVHPMLISVMSSLPFRPLKKPYANITW